METLQATPTAPFDHDAAAREGWAVVACGPTFEGAFERQLQRLDTPPGGGPAFAEDRDAWLHVVSRARAGSVLHRAALDAVDEVERMLIEATWGYW